MLLSREDQWPASILGVFLPVSAFVFVLCCTQKLLDRLNFTSDPEPAAPDTVLGDWDANLIQVGRTQVVLAVTRSVAPS